MKSSGTNFWCWPTSKAEAKRLGLPRYDSGRLCPLLHGSVRSTANSTCLKCAHLRQHKADKLRARENKTFMGVPCKYGHGGLRLTYHRACFVCAKERIRRWQSRHTRENRPLYNDRSRAWFDKNPGKRAEYYKKKYERDPEPYKRRSADRRARKAGAEGSYTKADVSALFLVQRGKCTGGCGYLLRDGYHVDHKTPLSRGGSNWPDNLQLLCQPCNDSKGVKTDEEWRSTFTN